MHQNWTSKRGLRTQVLAALSLPLLMTAGGARGQEVPGAQARLAQAGSEALHTGPIIPRVYSVINLAPDNSAAFLNEQGQAAVSSFVLSTTSFFDGDRLHDFGAPGETWLRGLNNRGTVTGLAYDNARPHRNQRAFRWTLGGGMRLLPGLRAQSFDINDRNEIVGYASDRLSSVMAVRWDADGRLRPLLPRPPSQSMAHAINSRGLAGGFADVAAEGPVQAVLWDPAGRQAGLGSLGGTYASADFVNERGEAAGQVFGGESEPARAFFWNPRSGMASLTSPDARNLYLSDLNDQGSIAGIVQARDATATDHSAFRWSRLRGLEWLAPGTGPGIVTDLTDLDNRNQMVGSVERLERQLPLAAAPAARNGRRRPGQLRAPFLQSRSVPDDAAGARFRGARHPRGRPLLRRRSRGAGQGWREHRARRRWRGNRRSGHRYGKGSATCQSTSSLSYACWPCWPRPACSAPVPARMAATTAGTAAGIILAPR